MKTDYKSTIFLLLSIFICILTCNLLTPFIYKMVKTDRTRTTILLETIKKENFNPEILIFGNSKSMYGIDAYQLSKGTGYDCYNFSSVGQPIEESSLFYSQIPKSTKIVIQAIEAPFRDINKKEDNSIKRKLSSNIVSSFYLAGYSLDEETRNINPFLDLSDFDENFFKKNYKARGAIVIPAITSFLVPRETAEIEDLKFPNGIIQERHPLYKRTIVQQKRLEIDYDNLEVDLQYLNKLHEYNDYLTQRNIKVYYIMMPLNPDLKTYTYEQYAQIQDVVKKYVPNSYIINFLDLVDDSAFFFDAAHLNKKGARFVTSALIEKINID